MARALRVNISPEEIIEAVKGMKKKEREAFLENLLAATSPNIWKASQRLGKTTNPGE